MVESSTGSTGKQLHNNTGIALERRQAYKSQNTCFVTVGSSACEVFFQTISTSAPRDKTRFMSYLGTYRLVGVGSSREFVPYNISATIYII